MKKLIFLIIIALHIQGCSTSSTPEPQHHNQLNRIDSLALAPIEQPEKVVPESPTVTNEELVIEEETPSTNNINSLQPVRTYWF